MALLVVLLLGAGGIARGKKYVKNRVCEILLEAFGPKYGVTT